MISLNKGTIEFLKATITDANPTTAITDLGSYSPEYKVTDVPITTDIVAWTAANDVDLMIVYCLIDTTIVGFVGGNTYNLYVRFSVSPEYPVLGPAPFKVIAA